ncbi:MAG: DUF1328 domain-containing protein [Saprospiraceae bacterium]|nr:DUF1328 domain-containing protein [Saprospiraceae bacterium]
MLRWSVMFLIIALVSAILGFSALAGTAAYFAKILFLIAMIVFLASLVFGHKKVNS